MLHEEAGYTTASDLSHRHDSVFSLIAGRSPYTRVRRWKVSAASPLIAVSRDHLEMTG